MAGPLIVNATVFLRDIIRGFDELELLECKNVGWEWYPIYSSEVTQQQ